MKIHILGICGKFMAGIAIIAKQKGFQVSGSDANFVEPYASLLRTMSIDLHQGYEADSLPGELDHVIIGNALSRGQPVIEWVLNQNIPYCSGPQWLFQNVLKDRWVVAVSGTHGKTTTTSMLAWIMEVAGLNPGFLIGGNANNFDSSARYTDSNFFVIEADEYDTAFFDKRSKFMHYHPSTLIFNNLEFDHADIFENLEDIKKQFTHLLRIVPQRGLIVAPSQDANVISVLARGCFSSVETFGHQEADWTAKKMSQDGSEFEVFYKQAYMGCIKWDLLGDHNLQNALAAIAAARHAGVPAESSIRALNQFKGVKRRLELRGRVNEISVYDDFAHHPTAIATTLSALRSRVGNDRIFAVLEFGSNTMRAGWHTESIASAFSCADEVVLLKPKSDWSLEPLLSNFCQPVRLFDHVEQIVSYLSKACCKGDHILCMSNLQFDDIHQKLLMTLPNKESER